MRCPDVISTALGALVISTALRMSAASTVLQSDSTQATLLELYTSEGCSSCPPAEIWLSRLKNRPGLWKDFVPVAFHVDYWDSLGWKDPFATKAWSERQSAYAELWLNSSVYTPGFVLDGKEWRGWNHHDAPPRTSTKSVGVLTARSDDGTQWELRFEPAGKDALSSYDFHAALLGFDLSSEVKAGENRGQKLEHDFVVLAHAAIAATKSVDAFRGALVLRSAPAFAPKRLGVALWLTPSNKLQPLQAVGGWLSSTNQAR